MRKLILAAVAAAALSPAATFARGFHLSIGLGGIRIGTGYNHCDSYGPRYVAAPVYCEPAVTYCAPPPVTYVAPPKVVYQAPVYYSAPPVYVAPTVVYPPQRVYSYPVAPAGVYYGR